MSVAKLPYLSDSVMLPLTACAFSAIFISTLICSGSAVFFCAACCFVVAQEARKTADQEYHRIVSDAEAVAKQLKEDAKTEAENQKTQILKNAEKEIADMVIDATAKVVASEKATSNSAIYDRFLNKAGDE